MEKDDGVGPITRAMIAQYANIIGDSNPIHLDDGFAREAGMPSITAQGSLTVAFIVDRVAAQFDGAGLRSLSVRLRAPVLADDELRIIQTGDNLLEVRRTDGGDVVATGTFETG